MKKDKFDTFMVLLGNAFQEMASGKEEQHVTIISANGYNLTVNFVVSSRYPEIVQNAPKMEFNEINFLTHLPREFGVDLTSEQLQETFAYLKSLDKFKSMARRVTKDNLFMFTDDMIVLLMREEYDKTGLN